MSATARIPGIADVRDAAVCIANHTIRTPVLTSRALDEEFAAEIFFKCENLQHIGAFKFRGAFNALSRLSAEHRRAGVVAYSSGNHAQAIALSATLLSIPAYLVMPEDAPVSKLNATRELGGQVVLYDRYRQDREKIGQELADKHGLSLIPPYDHADVIAGQGTAALELFEEVGQLDALFVPLGGGGLLAGSALAARALSPSCELYGVEPEAGNDGQQSFRSGRIVHIETPQTLADGAQTQHLGTLTFPIIRREVSDVLTVRDSELVDGLRSLASHLKLVVEPTGCLGFAGARTIRTQLQGKRIGVLISGGNIDLAKFATLLSTNSTPN